MMNTNKTRLLTKGEIINETYCVDFFIGEGAFGEVYRVTHKFLAESQVLKVFKQEYVANTDLDLIFNEGRLLAKLTHPSIVRVFDLNTFLKAGESYYFMAMAFVSGESLAQLLKRKIRLPAPVAISLMVDVLRGLAIAHKNKPTIIHRDISPDNILLSYDNIQPLGLLCDFGLARSHEQVSQLTGAGGKYLYFAPECFLNLYLPASDVFSAGVVFYQMLVGSHPWEYCYDDLDQNDTDAITNMIISSRKSRPTNPSYFQEQIDEQLDEVILRSLETDLEKRYRTAGAFLRALQSAVVPQPLPNAYWTEQGF